ncbi:DSBA-like thioredoxin domain-containing protein [Podospora appendiculata]|uniref:DSBA-like thioredoxin domain-containing protein n=1 Tax=Podospora appendiculata TaxID=314037 RepID=A0AAE0XGJ9_9PEZI|nr:DSBA-like thioredoxin domain-containing protein [Podospora appendiculata]
MAAKFTIDVEVYSDTACPWCYIGKKSLDRAMETFRTRRQQQQHGNGDGQDEQVEEVEFNVVWKPFLLFSKARVSGYQKGAPIISMYGLARAPAVFARLQTAGAAHGITFLWEGRTGNTLDSHKLIMLAREQGKAKQDATIAALYRGVFETGKDPSDREFLVATALAVGLAPDEAAVLAWLDGDEAQRMVCESASRPGEAEAAVAAARAARAKGGLDDITAVPSYVVQGRFRVGGMQEPEVFVGLFERVLRERGGGSEARGK